MMFDPPDFPYKDLNETMKEHYGTEDLIFSNTEPNLFNERTDDASSSGPQNLHNPELYIVQTENLFNYEPVLLDDNTVNEFLLPLQVTSDSSKETTSGPDLLALHSCSICHEIFINENDLLDHSISMHTIGTTVIENVTENVVCDDLRDENTPNNETNNRLQLDTEWLVCGVCERVLSTALEVEPVEQLCCKDENGKTKLCSRTLMTMYVCEYCSSLFADGDALDRHRVVCNSEDKENYTLDQNLVNFDNQMSKSIDLCFSCEICGTQNSTVEELKAHSIQCRPAVKEKRHKVNGTTTKMWNCGSCNQLFATARDLYRHKRGEDRPEGSPITAFVCEQCDKVLGSMCALHTHKKMHKVTKPGYPCRVCGRRFNQSGHLAIHMRMHTGERPYPCDLCPKAFKVKVERDDHRRTHTGERPFACNACPKTFTAAARLREHARIHTDQRPYRCDICGAAFRRPYARTVHTLIHTGAKPHECDVCGTAFRRSGDMWKHKRTIHGSTPGFSGD